MAQEKPGVKKLRTITIRNSLITAMVSLVLLITVGTMFGTIIIARDQVQSISISLVNNATEHVAAEMKSLFRPVPGSLVLVDRFAQQEGFDAADTVCLNKLFMPLVSSMPMVNSANMGDEEGNSYTLLADGQEWVTRELRPDEWGQRVKCRRWQDENTAIKEWWDDEVFDVRQKPWYIRAVEKQAVVEKQQDERQLPTPPSGQADLEAGKPRSRPKGKDQPEGRKPANPKRKKPKSNPQTTNRQEPAPDAAKQLPPTRGGDSIKPEQAADANFQKSMAERRAVSWTEPYYLGETKVPAITGALMISPTGGQQFVAAFDLLLTDISKFTKKLKPSENGVVWVMTTDSKMIGLPRKAKVQQHETSEEDILKPIGDLKLQSINNAIGIWRTHMEHGDDMSVPQKETIGGHACWISMSPFTLTDGRSVQIFVMLPESDFFDPSGQQVIIFVIGILALVFALAISVYLAGRYSNPLRSLVEQSERLQRLDLADSGLVATNLKEVQQLTDSHDNMRKALGSFAHYVPTQLVRELLERGEAASIGVKERELTVMFSDIAGFTTIAEKLDPAQLTEQIAEHFEAGLDALQSGGATIDKLMGDGIMAFWGAPKADDEHDRNAVLAVLEYAKRIEQVNKQWEQKGWPRFETRIGLASGNVLVGNIGTYSRFDYTVVGDNVNLASRLEGINKLYGTQVLVSEQTKLGAGAGFAWRMVDKVSVKGKQIPVRIYELLGYDSQIDRGRLAFVAQYETALGLFWERQFTEAAAVLRGVKNGAAGDLSVIRLANLCQRFEQQVPPAGWDGSTEAVL